MFLWARPLASNMRTNSLADMSSDLASLSMARFMAGGTLTDSTADPSALSGGGCILNWTQS